MICYPGPSGILSRTLMLESNVQGQQVLYSEGHLCTCDLCNKPFGNKSNLKRHLSVHNGEWPYTCNVCTKSVCRVVWRCVTEYLLDSIHTPVMCAVNHLHSWVVWRYINACYVVSNRTPVMCAVNHSYSRVVWRYISARILESNYIPVMCVVILCEAVWRHIVYYILERIDILVMSVINHTVSSNQNTLCIRHGEWLCLWYV